MTTPIEDRADWKIHRAAALTVRSQGGHFFCAEAIGFIAANRDGEELSEDLGKPCARCLGIWEVAKQQEGKAA